MITAERNAALVESLRNMTGTTEDLAADFYDLLFERAPEVRPMFGPRMRDQHVKLAATLGTLIDLVCKDETRLRQRLLDLGRAHAGYGALPEHYPVVAECLIDALRGRVGAFWLDHYADAWRQTMQVVADTMLEGADQARTSAA